MQISERIKGEKSKGWQCAKGGEMEWKCLCVCECAFVCLSACQRAAKSAINLTPSWQQECVVV